MDASASAPPQQTPVSGAPDRAVFALPVAIVIGLDLLGRAVAISAVVFTGALAAGQVAVLELMLLASLLGIVVTRTFGRFPPSVVLTAQQAPMAALLPALAAIAGAGMAGGIAQQQAIATALAVIGLTSVLTGFALIGLSRFDLGRFVRFLPYPVSTGFLAATGALLAYFALRSALQAGADAAMWGLLPLAMTFGMAGFLALCHRLAGEAGVAAGLIIAFGLFHTALFGAGADLATAQGWDLLPDAAQKGAMTLLPQVLSAVDGATLVAALPHVPVAVLIAILANYLSIGAIELGANVDLAGRKAARMTGLANVLTGGLGGPVVFSSPSSSVVAHIMRGNHPLMPVLLGLFLLVCVVLAQSITGLVPGFLSGGLLLFLGGRILWLWLVLPARQMPAFETVLSCIIVAVTLLAGMLPAIMLGSVIAVILFALRYAQLPVIRRQGGLGQWRSNVDRSPPQSAALDAAAGRVAVLQAEGFLFFGSVDQLNVALGDALDPRHAPRSVILDCARVSGADAAACAVIARMALRGGLCGHRVFVAGGPKGLQEGLRQQMAEMGGPAGGGLHLFPDLDQALERAEDDLISVDQGDAPDALHALRHLAGDAAPPILAQMERLALGAGEKLITAGEYSRDVFVLDQGRLGIYVAAPSGTPLRLRIVRAGAIVGEMASYMNGQRSADVVAEEPCEVLVMRADVLERLRQTAPDTFAAWHRVMAQALAEKLARTTRALAEQK